MQVLYLAVNHQRVTWTNCTRWPVEGSRGEVFVSLSLDSEWDGRAVTVLCFNSFRIAPPIAVLWTGEPIEVPEEVLFTGDLRIGLIGVADDGRRVLPTIWMPRGIPVHRSGGLSGVPAEETTPELWEQVLSAVGSLSELATLDKSSIVAAINELYRTGGGGSGGGGGGSFANIDNTLRIKDGVLGVNTADKVEQDNTLPITSAAVHTTVGNIEVLLGTI